MGCSASVRVHDEGSTTKDSTVENDAEDEAEVCHILSSKSSKRVASQILQNKEGYEEILKHPARANLPDGSPLIAQFRRVFVSIGGDGEDAGVTACQLEAALDKFARALSPAIAMRVALMVSEVFEEIGLDETDAVTWPAFVNWLEHRDVEEGNHDEALSELFELCDFDGTGRINAQELMDLLLLVSQLGGQKDPSKCMKPDVAEAIVRDLDCTGLGGIGYHEFMEVMQSVRTKPTKWLGRISYVSAVQSACGEAHLVLNFDVNNTVMMLDSATGAKSQQLLGAVFANTAWGVVEQDENGKPKNWVLKHKDISVLAPTSGMTTFKEYVDTLHPVDNCATKEQQTAAKKRRREAIWSFTDPGHPGERFRKQLEEMNKALLLPEHVRGTPKAVAAGLEGSTVQLLPSFLHMLRELKRTGRTFTLMFRTFGHDLELVEKELNALCEGRHPLFPDDIKLDGSDGCPDYRIHLKRPSGCGTFFRNPDQDEIALVMGTIRQPRTMEDFPGFYEGHDGISIHKGHSAVIHKIMELSGQQKTIALRDFYSAWASVGMKSRGGKPFFLSWHDEAAHSIFFDDNITAADPKIVDPINAHHWPRRFCNPQLLGVHLVQAQPLHSMTNRDYFLECIRECEAARRLKLKRWDLAQRLLGDLAGVQHVLTALVSGTAKKEAQGFAHKSYQPWCTCKKVSLAQGADTFDEDPMDT